MKIINRPKVRILLKGDRCFSVQVDETRDIPSHHRNMAWPDCDIRSLVCTWCKFNFNPRDMSRTDASKYCTLQKEE